MDRVTLPRALAVLRVAALLVAILVPVLVAANLVDRPAPLAISVDGHRRLVERGSTLGDAIRVLDLRPDPGRLLDVEGDILNRRADPGQILLDGSTAPESTPLADGDIVRVVDGLDRTERTRVVRRRLPGRQPGDPMFSLATGRVIESVTAGRISGKVVSITYRSAGGSTSPPQVALTFDDGPWPRTTRAVLAVLRRMHVRATFFMVGYLAARYPGIVRDVIHAGMTIGDHSWSHPTPFADLAPHRMQTEIGRPAHLLRTRFAVRPTLFRAPGGSFDGKVVKLARDDGMRMVQWDVDPRDYLSSATPKRIARTVLREVEPGSIVLLHDGGGDQSATVRALRTIIHGIRKRGLKLVPIEATAPS